MISARKAKLINILPKGLLVFFSKRVFNRILKKYANIQVSGQDRLKTITRPTIFVCNHLSNSDGLILSKALKEVDPYFVAGVKLNDSVNTNLGASIVKTTAIVPNSADHAGLKRIIKLVKSGESILLFPEGTRSRTGSLIEPKRGILLIARKTKAPIVPIGLYGSEKLLPINMAGDMNAEKFHHADVHVEIGEQFELPAITEEQSRKEYQEYAANYIMKKIAELLPEDYRGIYK